jgi:hypothetical protein
MPRRSGEGAASKRRVAAGGASAPPKVGANLEQEGPRVDEVALRQALWLLGWPEKPLEAVPLHRLPRHRENVLSRWLRSAKEPALGVRGASLQRVRAPPNPNVVSCRSWGPTADGFVLPMARKDRVTVLRLSGKPSLCAPRAAEGCPEGRTLAQDGLFGSWRVLALCWTRPRRRLAALNDVQEQRPPRRASGKHVPLL